MFLTILKYIRLFFINNKFVYFLYMSKANNENCNNNNVKT